MRVTRRTTRHSPRVREVMTVGLVATHAQEPLAEVAVCMRDNAVGAVAIMDGDELKGIVTERDLMRATADGRSPRATLASAYMTPDPATIIPEETVEEAAARMVALTIRHLPVMEEGRVVGVISARDVLASGEVSKDLAQLAYEPW
jgi:CBS domain-containing protein